MENIFLKEYLKTKNSRVRICVLSLIFYIIAAYLIDRDAIIRGVNMILSFKFYITLTGIASIFGATVGMMIPGLLLGLVISVFNRTWRNLVSVLFIGGMIMLIFSIIMSV